LALIRDKLFEICRVLLLLVGQQKDIKPTIPSVIIHFAEQLWQTACYTEIDNVSLFVCRMIQLSVQRRRGRRDVLYADAVSRLVRSYHDVTWCTQSISHGMWSTQL